MTHVVSLVRRATCQFVMVFSLVSGREHRSPLVLTSRTNAPLSISRMGMYIACNSRFSEVRLGRESRYPRGGVRTERSNQETTTEEAQLRKQNRTEAECKEARQTQNN